MSLCYNIQKETTRILLKSDLRRSFLTCYNERRLPTDIVRFRREFLIFRGFRSLDEIKAGMRFASLISNFCCWIAKVLVGNLFFEVLFIMEVQS